MSIRVALYHKTHYRFDRPVRLGPHVVRLRPAPHARTPIESYSLKVSPGDHFVNWQQDPHANYLARYIFDQAVDSLLVEVDLLVDMTVINPFDFFLEPQAEAYPFGYAKDLLEDLEPFLRVDNPGPKLVEFLQTVDRSPKPTIDFLVGLNQRFQQLVDHVIRLEAGVQSCEETLSVRSGSCRDTSWLLVNVLRHLGFAARFASGYLIQLKPDEQPLDGPAGTDVDCCDLHAWAEVFLPGAGWIGLDPTSGLLAGEGHIPLACAPHPTAAAPVSGTTGTCESTLQHEMTVTRIHEDPRVTKPYTQQQWDQIEALGIDIDRKLEAADVRLTMGGEPTFVSIDDMEGNQCRTAAMGPMKRTLASNLLLRLKKRFAPDGCLQYGQAKQYPGEPLPRWPLRCYWRTDGQPIWCNPDLLADDSSDYGHGIDEAQAFARCLAERLGVSPNHVMRGYEDVLYYMWKERRLPANVGLLDNNLENEQERQRLAAVFEQGVTSPVGCCLPLQYQWWLQQPRWVSGLWQVRSDEMFLIPGDWPMGFRLPLESLQWTATRDDFFPRDPLEIVDPLPDVEQIRRQLSLRRHAGSSAQPRQLAPALPSTGGSSNWAADDARDADSNAPSFPSRDDGSNVTSRIVRTALCVEPRHGKLHVFIPPIDRFEHYLELIAAIEETAESLGTPVVIEGYFPPQDCRHQHIAVTPDPGVIEVSVHPAHNWKELTEFTRGIYEDATESRLGAEKFDLDGTHTGTGGGNHVVLGGATPADSPFLRRPDLLRSLLAFWHNHPSLSYLFSGRFVGPTSQAPRVDDGRRDSIYELKIAFEQIPDRGGCAPWLVDRVFRNLLVDLTGNTRRTEFCIDKLYSPDSSAGRLGLVEFRAFEMPPHYQMSLTQQLLLRALVSRFWNDPYDVPLVNWNTTLHDRFLLPHFVWQDFEDVIAETNAAGYTLDKAWFAPHFEFRFPRIGQFTQRSLHVELRQAIEPWHVLGEEQGATSVARYVDSSVERLQVRVRAMTDPRYLITCNGRKVPLHPTGVEGEFVAGVRYRAWQPPTCLHPTIPVDHPLTFDVYDKWLGRSIGGCTYHVGHPGGLNPSTFPVNAYEAESRRGSRFFTMGHSVGTMNEPQDEPNAEFPLTLDLRRGRR